MNKDIIMQIAMEATEIPDGKFQPGYIYRVEDGKEFIGPIGHHILKHHELISVLDVKTDAYSNKSFSTKDMSVNRYKLGQYLGLSEQEVEFLFQGFNTSKAELVDTARLFVDGKIEVRRCFGDYGCDSLYAALPDDTRCVCDDCMETLMAMCGIEQEE